VIVGGDGNDKITGGGRSLMIGGDGADSIDVLIGNKSSWFFGAFTFDGGTDTFADGPLPEYREREKVRSAPPS
jgi:hypothetical protein